jgi:hypothetical protein
MRDLHQHRRPAQQDDYGSSQIDRLPPEQSSAERKLRPSLARAAWPIVGRSGERRRSPRHSRALAAPRRSGSASVVRGRVWPRCRPAAPQAQASIAPASAVAGRSARNHTRSLPTATPCGPCSGIPSGRVQSPPLHTRRVSLCRCGVLHRPRGNWIISILLARTSGRTSTTQRPLHRATNHDRSGPTVRLADQLARAKAGSSSLLAF